ncbi:zinc-binding dehydrogenase [Burkholderia cenocepacia]|uniref:zinc-binding dehydrogenase n=1 Tax=Burkholderia cenocepacia TaxID=95486 RepID=UPI001BAC07DD|nr:zinc-binding dehydrogenase [Burkholderia cenocepacia]QUN38669.1 zinc-binding dehydrogenase [Burkholderia cenocepacia]QUO29428.1 zinc-binding dehydrogenase [Burkholderia cenocepacia]
MIDYQAGPVEDWLDGRFPLGIDGLVDLVSDETGFAQLFEFVRPNGVALSTVGAARDSELAAYRVNGGNFEARATAGDLSYLVNACASGRLRAMIDRGIPLTETPNALDESRAGRTVGKTVVVI